MRLYLLHVLSMCMAVSFAITWVANGDRWLLAVALLAMWISLLTILEARERQPRVRRLPE